MRLIRGRQASPVCVSWALKSRPHWRLLSSPFSATVASVDEAQCVGSNRGAYRYSTSPEPLARFEGGRLASVGRKGCDGVKGMGRTAFLPWNGMGGE